MYKNKDLEKPLTLVSQEIIEEEDMNFLYDYEEELHYILKDYEHYLTFAFNCTWNNASGYKIYNDILGAFGRDYDYTQELISVSKGNKSCLLKEYHHDKPLGHNVVIVGLTEQEYNKLVNTSFEEIEKFALANMEKLNRG